LKACHAGDKIKDKSMQWIHHYQLFLFDFDGLLVNTEEIHYQAYKRMCAGRGFQLKWDFNRYTQAAHLDADALRDQIYAEFPALQNQEPNWNVHEGAVQLMPGVDQLLRALQEAQILRCVVTHSALELIQIIRSQNPVLNTIPNWITREDYARPKPHPDCYQLAIERFAKPQDQVIGFEDTPRGLNALRQTRAQAILICPADYCHLQELKEQGVQHYASFNAITEKLNPSLSYINGL
jgi:beta-phosphoglucomutase